MTALPAGAGALFWLYFKRDRVKLPIWVLAISIFVPYFTFVTTTLYPTLEDMQPIADLVGQTAFGAFFVGPGYGIDALDSARMVVHVYGIEFILAAAIMNILLVARHVRGDEESARGELLRAGAISRHAPITAALLLALAANAALGLIMAVLMMVLGHSPAPSLLFGASVGAAGLVFAGISALTGQIAQTAGGGALLAGIVLALTTVARGIGDAMEQGGSWLSWTSPIAWSQQTRAFVDDRWWPLLLSLAIFAATAAVAHALLERRDFGAGLLAPAPGRTAAPKWLASPLTLVWRLQRRSIIVWSVAFALAGLVYGSLGATMIGSLETFTLPDSFLGSADTFGIDLYFGLIASFMSFLAAIFVMLSMGQFNAQETRGMADPVLATTVRRSVWMSSHLAVTLAGGLALLAMAGAGMGISSAIGMGDPELFLRSLLAHLARFPEIAALAGLMAALYGLLPGVAFLGWIAVIYGVALTFYVPAGLDTPVWLHLGSPFGLIDRLPPFEALDPATWFGLLAVAALLAGAGAFGFTRRDVR